MGQDQLERKAMESPVATGGAVAEALGELEEAKVNYMQDLQITAEFNDQNGLGISFRNLARFYQSTQDNSLISTVAETLGVTVEQVQELFANFSDGESDTVAS
ncbi:hypothetical protein [Synechococcus sp. PCC 7336]|uniref:hypothetical protein n=1 Tax=Synechococcus sp. PCC 7336 TaxID=195250 RepID=UPI0003724ACB|nr:hypothetical protein [Synechococcus sp. PCC 7336]